MIIKASQILFSKIIFAAALALFFAGCQQNVKTTCNYLPVFELDSVSKDDLKLMVNEGLYMHENSPFSGYAVEYFAGNNLETVTLFQCGKKHGSLKKWFESGVKSYSAEYTDGKLDGISSTWWRNGKLRSTSNFKDGVPEGVQLQWYKSGAKFKVRQLANGIEDGIQQSWRENGKIYNNYEAKNGRIFGLKRANLCYELTDEEVVYND